MTENSYDVVVIGGGPPGENAAARAHAGGLSVALVEHELVGGECSYWACMPSKALLRPVELYEAANRLPGVREAVTGGLDTAAVLKRRDWFVGRDDGAPFGHDDGPQVGWVTGAGLTFERGHARLAGERRVAVAGTDGGTKTLTANHAVVLATGTYASVPPIPGLREAQPWTSREVTNMTAVPDRLVVLGGGVVACEMAQAVRGLGASEVTIVERGGRLLAKNEEFAGALVTEAFEAAGITVRTGVAAESVSRDGGHGPVTVRLADGSEIVADEVLAALGRRPTTDDLGLETVGLKPGDYVEVDDHMEALGGWLYGCGDVIGRALLTHMGKYQARVCGDVIAARAAGTPLDGPRYTDLADDRMVPQVTFTYPQVCSVGLTEAQAVDRGFRVRAVEYDIGTVSGAKLVAEGYTGRAKAVVDEDRRVLLGVTFVGPELAELLHSATVAVVGEVPLDRLWHAVPSYPTISEVWLRLLETYGL